MVIKLLGIIKGDARYEYLKSEKVILSDEIEDFYNIDTLLLPLMGIDDKYNIKQSKLNLLDVFKYNSIKKIIVGKANTRLKEFCESKKIALYEFLNDEDYVIENAKLTAMGIIEYLNTDGVSIKDKKITIFGFGNIGFELAKMLSIYETKFDIYSTDEVENKFIKLLNYTKADFSNMQIIINTIPSNLNWDYEIFKDKRIIDVASWPYGFDIAKINNLNIKYEILSSIPAKFYPYSAAQIIKKYIEK